MAPCAREAAESAGDGDSVVGWKLDREQRKELLQQFPPRYGVVDADHVTLRTRAAADCALPDETLGDILGRIDDGLGVEAIVVAIAGTTDRPGGGTYHITWSRAPGREARESNDVLAQGEWTAFDLPMPVKLEPCCWSRGA
ncbi:MAG: hypothetical protein QOJ91_3125 [Sphingomonadales bacterium]|nr:hypothetical protein [Sphingomonadales bacterium]